MIKYSTLFLLFIWQSYYCQAQNVIRDTEYAYVEIFATCRFTIKASADMGIYDYNYSKESLFYPRINTYYATDSVYDSVFQYFYCKVVISKDSILKLSNVDQWRTTNEPFYYPDRMILVFHLDSFATDTLILNDDRLLKKTYTFKMDDSVKQFLPNRLKAICTKRKYYQINDSLLLFIIYNLPVGLKDNWSLTNAKAKILKRR